MFEVKISKQLYQQPLAVPVSTISIPSATAASVLQIAAPTVVAPAADTAALGLGPGSSTIR
ncbi:hypothetical protein [Pedobacter nototheniae]|uniref:hypothetical protein n=1 Tax=Pedobacter nototheniae TaxID=2488994 RepID=UPI00103B2A8C|nr:hypothetical protein [Pedobacter nototheniae]